MRILVAPRWGGTIDDDWYPWLAEHVPGVVRTPLPDRDAPSVAAAHATLRPRSPTAIPRAR